MKKQTYHIKKDKSLGLAFILLLVITYTCMSCKKYLDEKPDRKLTTPTTFQDLEKMLDNYDILNARFPNAAEVSADNYYLTDEAWASVDEYQRNFYLWQKYDDIGGDWLVPYNNIFNANIILETLKKLQPDSNKRWNQLEGSALFIRAFNHFSLSQLFAPPYIKTSAKTDLGIPLRLHSDLDIKPVRSSVLETYNSILSDLKNAVPLLSRVVEKKYHPSRAAAYALLARVYLTMNDYPNAGIYADSSLELYNVLIDYNEIDPDADIPFSKFNEEVIYDAESTPPPAMLPFRARIDTNLYAAYDSNDLRKRVFFHNNSDSSKAFKGSYTGDNFGALFVGLATDEMYLIKAESLARDGNTNEANDYLNSLMVKRWKTGFFIPYTANQLTEVLRVILTERRKELLYRTLRWSDLRRLNQDPMWAQKLFRKINGKVYELDPGSPRYTLQIDRDAVNISGLQQNP